MYFKCLFPQNSTKVPSWFQNLRSLAKWSEYWWTSPILGIEPPSQRLHSLRLNNVFMIDTRTTDGTCLLVSWMRDPSSSQALIEDIKNHTVVGHMAVYLLNNTLRWQQTQAGSESWEEVNVHQTCASGRKSLSPAPLRQLLFQKGCLSLLP